MITDNQGRSPQLLYGVLLLVLAAAGITCWPGYAQEAHQLTGEVLSPREYQVAQRDSTNRGTVSVTVHIDGQPRAVEVRLGLMADHYKGTSTDWVALAATDEPGGYSGEVTAAAGGWYELQVRVQTAQDNPVIATVPHIGIGEVFITAGQSNTANRGNRHAPTDDRVVTFDGQGWRPAYDPQPDNDGEGGTPWPHLGDLLARSLQMPIGFGCRAVGGTPSHMWLPGADPTPWEHTPHYRLYERLKTVAQQLGVNGARAVLWHQGESDAQAGTSAEIYADNLTRIIKQLNQDAGYEIPWVVAAASFLSAHASPEATQQVVDGQRLLWERGIALQGPATNDLIGPVYREADEVHFNNLGKQVYAERLFAMLWAQFYADVPLVMREK